MEWISIVFGVCLLVLPGLNPGYTDEPFEVLVLLKELVMLQ